MLVNLEGKNVEQLLRSIAEKQAELDQLCRRALGGLSNFEHSQDIELSYTSNAIEGTHPAPPQPLQRSLRHTSDATPPPAVCSLSNGRNQGRCGSNAQCESATSSAETPRPAPEAYRSIRRALRSGCPTSRGSAARWTPSSRTWHPRRSRSTDPGSRGCRLGARPAQDAPLYCAPRCLPGSSPAAHRRTPPHKPAPAAGSATPWPPPTRRRSPC